MKRVLTIIMLLPLLCNAQKQGYNWYFGQGAAVSFATGSPVFISGGQTSSDDPYEGQEGTSSISDSAGNLLFYSGGQTVWNQLNLPMPNGSHLNGGASSTQACLAVPLPGSSNIFYLFTTDEFQSYENGTGKGLCYTIINMCLDSGYGDVVPGSKNILLMDSNSEKLCAVQDQQGTGYWILGRKTFTDEFYAWHLTSAGIASPVISHIDTFTFQQGWASGLGQMKFSPDGTKVALVWGNSQPAPFSLFDFNPTTGVVSNKRAMLVDDLTQGAYGLEFSADGTKLYVPSMAGNGPNTIWQFDLTAGGGTASAIMASRYAVFSSSSVYLGGGMQMAPDNKIYLVSGGWENSLGSISNTNLAGAGAVFTDSVLVYPASSVYALTSFIAGYPYHNALATCCNSTGVGLNYQLSSAGVCAGFTDTITLSGDSAYTISPTNFVTWLDSAHAVLNPDTTTQFTITGYLACGANQVKTFTLPVFISRLIRIGTSNPVICSGEAIQLCVPAGFSYNWSTGATSVCITTDTAGTYSVTASANGECSAISSQTVNAFTASPFSVNVHGDTLSYSNQVAYQWQLNGNAIAGATSSTYIAGSGGTYTLQITDTTGCTVISNPVVISGINSINDYFISIYPNPSTGAWELQVDNRLLGADAQVFDAIGKQVFKSTVTNLNSTISLPGAANGTYELRITMNGNSVVRKLVKM